MTLPVLPQDVFDEIFRQLTNTTSTLKSCSLVCRSFRRRTQKILFNFIAVTLIPDDDGSSQPFKLVSIVQQAPHLIEYVQKLQIFGTYFGRLNVDKISTDLPDTLGIFSRQGDLPINLRYLHLKHRPWDDIPPRLQDALVLLMTVQSLRDIVLDHVVDCPANLVQSLPPLLKYLGLINTHFPSLPTTRNELPKLESLTTIFLHHPLDDGFGKFPSEALERMADISQLKTFRATVCPYSMPAIEKFLRSASNSLEKLWLRFKITDPDSISIDLNQFPHLTNIIIPCFLRTSANSLSLIPRTFIFIAKTMKKTSHRNVLQSLTLVLTLGSQVDIDDSDSALKDVWQELDTICSMPQLALSKVFRGITFSIHSTVPIFTAFLDLVRSRLPETKKASKLHFVRM